VETKTLIRLLYRRQLHRGTNAFLKKQFDEQNKGHGGSHQAHHTARPAASGPSTPVAHPHALEVASPLYDEMVDSLQREQEHSALLRKQLQDLQLERHQDKLAKR
jgi:hypothetical protein